MIRSHAAFDLGRRSSSRHERTIRCGRNPTRRYAIGESPSADSPVRVLLSRMRLLVLGGTAWLGGYITAIGLERGHQVTCLARGASGAAPHGADFRRADRDAADAYREVAREEWDVVIDVSRQPGQVRRATTALAGGTGSFIFVSSGNVYADHATPGDDEGAALLPALAGDVMETMETYGQAKVACERHVRTAFGPDRSLIARVGLIGGPGDIFDRTGYWPLRFTRPAADDGSVLVPDVPDLMTQVIDVRDVATWLIEAGEDGAGGVFNVVGETIPLSGHLAIAREVAGHTGPVVPAGQDWLVAHGVAPWMGERSLPLWLPLPEYAGFSSRDGSAARSAGLVPRPLAETLTDTLAWELTRNLDRPRRAGLSGRDERRLLHALNAS
jgi:nucleoside-diphosphate-sugar epimerase